MIGGYKDEFTPKIVALDETLLMHNCENEQIWSLE